MVSFNAMSQQVQHRLGDVVQANNIISLFLFIFIFFFFFFFFSQYIYIRLIGKAAKEIEKIERERERAVQLFKEACKRVDRCD